MNLFKLTFIVCLFISCTMKNDNESIEKWKQEITKTELNFAKMAKEKGVQDAFLHFAANDAVLLRSNQLVTGKKEIDEHFNQQTLKDYTLEWSPDFVDVSASGDLGYTYGHYTFTYKDENGEYQQSTGIFHTVWKRQTDNSWKFVWD